MPEISVIVPVYRVEPWLSSCVDSILSQSFTDFELILVDDGSPDSCGQICENYAANDVRIKVIHRPNGGLSAARNSGLAIAQGRYVSFVDSDDTLTPEFLERLYGAAKQNAADMVVCGYAETDEAGRASGVLSYSNPFVCTGKEMLHLLFGDVFDGKGNPFVAAWNKLYRRELFADICYPEGRNMEDYSIVHDLYSRCGTVAAISECLYLYRVRGGSIMLEKSAANHLDMIVALHARIVFIHENGYNQYLEHWLKVFWRLFYRFPSIALGKGTAPGDKVYRARAALRKDLPLLFRYAPYPFIEKLRMAAFAYLPAPMRLYTRLRPQQEESA